MSFLFDFSSGLKFKNKNKKSYFVQKVDVIYYFYIKRTFVELRSVKCIQL